MIETNPAGYLLPVLVSLLGMDKWDQLLVLEYEKAEDLEEDGKLEESDLPSPEKTSQSENWALSNWMYWRSVGRPDTGYPAINETFTLLDNLLSGSESLKRIAAISPDTAEGFLKTVNEEDIHWITELWVTVVKGSVTPRYGTYLFDLPQVDLFEVSDDEDAMGGLFGD